MSKIDDGGPAFPWGDGVVGGLTKRDWFAGQALNGVDSIHILAKGRDYHAIVAKYCYSMADAMLAEGRKGGVE